MASHNQDSIRPITLYVSHVDTENLTLEHLTKRHISMIDIEMSRPEAEVLLKQLAKRVKDHIAPGAIRIRLYGHLTL